MCFYFFFESLEKFSQAIELDTNIARSVSVEKEARPGLIRPGADADG
jgi:hypothetical protein